MRVRRIVTVSPGTPNPVTVTLPPGLTTGELTVRLVGTYSLQELTGPACATG